MDPRLLKILQLAGITANDQKLYQTAFVHRSYLNEISSSIESNERLEFLGDSVLSLVVSLALFAKRAGDSEGDLTNLRAYIVKTESLHKAAQDLNLGQLLKLSRGEEVSGGRQNIQILANTYEALLGAIYLDHGLQPATSFVEKTLLPLFSTVIQTGAPRDPKSVLQEQSQSQYKASPKYKIISTHGPDHAKVFSVGVFIDRKLAGTGTGTNKQQAEEEAARQALEKLATDNKPNRE